MKKHRLALLALLLACGTACQQKEILPEPEKNVVITASFANPSTRISYTENAETHKLHQEWEVGDVLYGYSHDSEYLPLTLKVTAVDSGTGVATLEVESGELPSSGSIHMVYSADRSIDEYSHLLFEDDFPAAVNLCFQVAATGTTVPAILTADTNVSADADIHLVFENQTAILGIKGFHGLPPGATVESFFVYGVNNYAYFTYDDDNLGIVPSMYGDMYYTQDFIFIEKPGGWTADETGTVDETFYVAVFPNTEATEISLVAYDSQSNIYSNQLGSKTIAAGKYYYMNNKELQKQATPMAYVGSGSDWTEVYSIEEAFALASTATEDFFIYLSDDCAASADLSLTDPSTRSARDLSTVHVTLDLNGCTLDMNGHSICADAAGASIDVTNTYGTGALLQEADVPVFVVSDGTLAVLQQEEYEYYGTYCYNIVIKCTSNATGYSPMVVTGGQLRLEGGYYFFNTTARLISSTDADYAYVYKDCRFNKNPGFTASSCTLEPDHMIGKAKPVTVDDITYSYRYVDNHAAYDTYDGRFKHFTVNDNGDVVYLSKFNLNQYGALMSSGWDYTSDATCFLNRAQYEAAAENGYPSLSKDEWTYLLKSRTASTVNGVANARFVKCTFQEKRGLLIFPDEFEWPASAGSAPDASAINNATANYDTVIYRAYASVLTASGCVFLQADGYVSGGILNNANVAGNYWTSTTRDSGNAYYLDFGSFRSGMSSSYELKTTNYVSNDDRISVRPYFK